MDGNVIGLAVGPEVTPHLSRHFSVALTDGVAEAGRAKGEDGGVEPSLGVGGIGAEAEEDITIGANVGDVAAKDLLHQLEGEDVGSGRDGRMGGEDGRLAETRSMGL